MNGSGWWFDEDDDPTARPSSPTFSEASESLSNFLPGRFSTYIQQYSSSPALVSEKGGSIEDESEHQCFQAAMDLRLQMFDYHSQEPVFGGMGACQSEKLRMSVLVEEENVKGWEDDDEVYYTPLTSLHGSIESV
jgi:hypothetical protein